METEIDINSPFTQPWEILGYRKDGTAIWPIRGGAPDDGTDEGDDGSDDADGTDEGDDGTDDADGADDGDDDDDDDSGDDVKKPEQKFKKPPVKAGEKPPAARAQETKLELTLRREREGRKAAERQLRALRQKNESDAERLEREAEEKAEAKYKPAAIQSAARAALVTAKWIGDPKLGIRLLDETLIDVESDGEVSGINEQIAVMKEEYPQLFEADGTAKTNGNGNSKRQRTAAGRIDAGNKKPPDSDKKLTSAEKIAAMYEGADA